ncbi:cytochrome b5-like heme/steroid binding domain-containing protein [Haematococcus lacustris]
MSDFTFPLLAESAKRSSESVAMKAPLTAKSTVTSACNTGRNEVKPIQAVGPHQQGSTLERRNKVPLEKGYSQVDWMRLAKATPAPILRKDITVAEVRQHKTADDAWMIFRNKVYNIGPYLRFHPGGSDILLKVAGRDGTSLFMKYHPWVAISSLMERHLVGLLAQDPTPPPAKPAHQQQQQELTASTSAPQQFSEQLTAEQEVSAGEAPDPAPHDAPSQVTVTRQLAPPSQLQHQRLTLLPGVGALPSAAAAADGAGLQSALVTSWDAAGAREREVGS